MKVALIILSIIYIIFWVSVFIHTLNDSTSKASKTKWGIHLDCYFLIATLHCFAT
jgi:hypothetical protein